MKRGDETRPRRNDLLDDIVGRRFRLSKDLPARASQAERMRKRHHFRIRSIILIALAVGGVLWFSQDYLWSAWSHLGNAQHRAALIDPLSETLPDQTFLTETMRVIQGYGYRVDYYGPGNSTVDLFRDLPLKGYGLVIIRAHTSPAIFTGEPYSQTKYVFQQLTDQLEDGAASNNGFRFAVTDQFVRLSMRGTFDNSLIVNMGCSGLGSGSPIAEAFIDKGARDYVGWDGAVTVAHTDSAIASFLNAVLDGRTVESAVSASMSVVGPDPFFHSQLSHLDGSMLAQQRLSQRLVLLGGIVILCAFLFPVVGVFYGLRRLSK